MPIRFLAGTRILEAVRRANDAHTERSLGVAYWGNGAVDRLGLGADLSRTEVICDLWSEGCNADAIQQLIRGGAKIMTVEGFHAKTYLYADQVIIGSANASWSGLGTPEQPPPRTETATWCDDPVVVQEAREWFRETWRRGTPVDAAMVEAARGELAKVRESRRATLLHAIAHEPALFDGLDLWVTLYADGTVSDAATHTWEAVQGEYGEDDRLGYEERDEVPFYEVENDALNDCPAGRIFLDFPRSKKGKPTFGGIWKVRADGYRAVERTGYSLVLLDKLPSLRGRRIVDQEMKAFCAAMTQMVSDDHRVGSPEIRNAAQLALSTMADP